MLLTTLYLQTNHKTPLYEQIIAHIKGQLYNEQISLGDKLPSIRKLAMALQVSRTTIETAYNQLVAEGYLINKPKRGYFAASVATLRTATDKPLAKISPQPVAQYNFSNNYVDPASFPADLWRRYVNHTLKNPALLARYGEPQGEAELRRTLAHYSNTSRGVICRPEQIVVGAGIQSLLQILIDLLPSQFANIALEAPGFPQAEQLFRVHGWQTEHFSTEALHSKLPQLLYVSPSNPYKGRSLSSVTRLNLLHWAVANKAYILEDDYNGEFRYFSRPISSLQSMSSGDTVIYLGSFSRLLLPSLRLSYMVLPPTLLKRYNEIGHLYNQTSSTIEQLALTEFINSGALRRHVKRLRKLYNAKNTLLMSSLGKIFGDSVQILAYESGLHLRVAVNSTATAKQLATQALRFGVSVIPVYEKQQAQPELLFSFAGIRDKDIEPALLQLKKAWFL